MDHSTINKQHLLDFMKWLKNLCDESPLPESTASQELFVEAYLLERGRS